MRFEHLDPPMEAFIQQRSVARCVLTSARNCAAIYRGSRSGSATIIACIPDHVAIASDAIVGDLDPIFAERSATLSGAPFLRLSVAQRCEDDCPSVECFLPTRSARPAHDLAVWC